MTRASLLAAAGWDAAAGLAVLVGLVAISVIGSGLMSSSGAPPRTEAEVAREVAALPSSSGTARPWPSTSAPTRDTRTFPTRGGTVVAHCATTGAEIVSMSPNPGFAVHEQDGGAQLEVDGEFRSTTDNHDRVKVGVTCSAGVPHLSTRNGG